MKTAIAKEIKPVILAPGRIALAKKVLHPLGLASNSIAENLMVGGIAYILSQEQFEGSGPAIVSQIKAALAKNRLVLDKALSEFSEDFKPHNT